jgi:hypothetical protein
MPSTYTTNLGIEKIATGEQSGTWGTTTNTNFDLIDTAVNGIVSITLASAGTSGSPNDLPITDGTASNGRNKFIEFVDGGDLGATAYVQLTPNDAEKIVHIRNSLSGSRSIIVFQGTYNASNDFEIPNGADVTLKFDGAGTGATVTDVNVDLTVTGVTATSTASFSGATIDDLGTVTTADINGGTIDGTVIGGSSAAAGTFTTFTSTGIDDNATSTKLTVSDTGIDVTGTVTSDKAIVGYSRAAGTGGIVLYDDDQSENRLTLATGGGTGINAVINQAGGSFNITDASLNTVATFNDGGNVGIGTASPGSSTNYNTLTINGTTGGIVEFHSGGSLQSYILGNSSELRMQSQSTQPLTFNTNGTERMRIDSSGNVGIGTASPATTLHVETSGNTGIQLRSGTASYGNINFNDGATAKGQILYDHNGDYMRLYVNSAERMRIDSSGNVGIGTDSPADELHINNDSSNVNLRLTRNTVTGARISGSDGALSPAIIFETIASSTATERMRIDSSGYVGIGTTSPQDVLHVEGGNARIGADDNSNHSARIQVNSGGASGYEASLDFLYESNATPRARIAVNSSLDGLLFSVLSGGSITERMRLLGNGNLGIGTTSPGYKLQLNSVGDNDGLLVKSGSASYINYLLFGDSGSNTVGRLGYNHANNSMTFFTTDNERMRIDSSGKVGINTSTMGSAAGSLLTLSGTSASYTQFNAGTSGGGAVGTEGNGLVFYGYSGNLGSETYTKHMTLDSSGNVGIGRVPNANGVLQLNAGTGSNCNITFSENSTEKWFIGNVTSSDAFRFYDVVNASERMRITSDAFLLVGTTSTTVDQSNFGTRIGGTSGATLKSFRNAGGGSTCCAFGGNAGEAIVMGDGDLENTNNSYGAISDARLKSNIVDASSQIDDIMAVQVRSYTLNETGDRHIGVVAQELEASGMSGLVKTDDEGMKSVKYSILYMKAIKALQEAVTRIETLEAEVAALKGA